MLEVQGFTRMDEGEGGMGGLRGFGEAGQDQLELMGIAGDVSNRENPRDSGRACCRLDRDLVALEIEPPIGYRSKFG